MTMCKKGISSCSLVILVSVFCLTVHSKVVSANEGTGDDTNLPISNSDLPTDKTHQEDTVPEPNLSLDPTEPKTKPPSPDSHLPPSETIPDDTGSQPRALSFTQPSSQIYHDAEPPSGDNPAVESQPLDTIPDATGSPDSHTIPDATVSPDSQPLTLSFTQSSSQIYHDAEPPGGENPAVGSQLLGGVPIRVQKCCPPHQVLQIGQYNSECIDEAAEFVIDVFVANKTHYWNATKSSARNVTLVTKNPCTQSKYLLNPDADANDTFHLLHNSSLYVPYTMDMFTEDEYCVDTILTATSLVISAVICTATPKTDILHYFFGIGLIISVFSLIALAVYSMWRTDIDDDHKKCLAFFSGTMSASFFFLAVSFFFGKHFPRIVNILLAYIVYYLKLNYFVWLTVLCYDTYRCVKIATDNCINRESFIKRYMLAAYLIPVLFICINLIDKYNPALPNLYLEFSYSTSFLWAIFLFYLPTMVTVGIDIFIMCSVVLPKGRCKDFNEFIRYMRSEKWKPTPAPENISQLKNMYRRTCILCILILVFLFIDFVIFLLPSEGQQKVHFMFRDVVYCLQGLFVTCVFIRKDCWQKPKTDDALNMTELALLDSSNQNGNKQ